MQTDVKKQKGVALDSTGISYISIYLSVITNITKEGEKCYTSTE